MARAKGETIFVSPYTGEQFTSQFAFNDHMARWPEIARANGLQVDGAQPDKPQPAPSSAEAPAKRTTRRTRK